ncbi:MAG TPA: hypothetical protein VJL39_02925 [Candidatus Paceibacterota bacterium]
MKNNFHRNAERGFSLIELAIYVVMATLIFLAIAVSIQYAYRFYRELTIGPRADRVAASLIERVVRDIRTGSSIVLAESTFGVPTGSITISALDGGVAVEKRVAVSEGRITYTENDGTPLELTPADITVSRLLLTYLTSPVSEGVRIELELTYEMQGLARTKTYTGFAILRHSYE